MQDIRNFCIIAHIDHGKSTLADRFLEVTESVRKLSGEQVLDTMDLEQERGITIKLTPARMKRQDIELNLIDTPGHVDFQYEVSRSLAAVEGAILLVDASQGIQAQTLSTLYMALEKNLTIIPVLNKIDLPAADVPRATKELEQVVGIDPAEVISISAKTGEGVETVLDAVVERVAPPDSFKEKHLEMFRNNPLEKIEADDQHDERLSRALIFDSVFDQYKGVVAFVKVVNGTFQPNQKMHLLHSESSVTPAEVGFFTPAYVKDKALLEGQIGYIVTGQKSVRDAKIGDTIVAGNTLTARQVAARKQERVIPGFKSVKPFVYAGIYPLEADDYEKLKTAMGKLALNDSAIEYDIEHSKAMGHGFRCGFLGTLHMDIIKERLSREYNIDTIFTTPSVTYLVKMKYLQDDRISSERNIKDLVATGLWRHLLPREEHEQIAQLSKAKRIERLREPLKPWLVVKSGGEMPPQGQIEEIQEPMALVEIVGPDEFSGNIMTLAQDYRGTMRGMEYLDEQRVVWKYLLPMGEILVDFYDKLKSASKGYATMNYEFTNYQASELVRLDILINEDMVEAFSSVVHREKAYYIGKAQIEKLKELIPKHMFKIPLQAAIGKDVIARETISAIRKDVTAKCYGGDVSRKKKLLQRQKEGKKKMKQMGEVSIPNDIFIKMVSK